MPAKVKRHRVGIHCQEPFERKRMDSLKQAARSASMVARKTVKVEFRSLDNVVVG